MYMYHTTDSTQNSGISLSDGTTVHTLDKGNDYSGPKIY